jgi:hypothetical protein
VPLKVLDFPAPPPGDAYRHKLVLVRPDQHVAWRGDALPDDVNLLVARIRGAA